MRTRNMADTTWSEMKKKYQSYCPFIAIAVVWQFVIFTTSGILCPLWLVAVGHRTPNVIRIAVLLQIEITIFYRFNVWPIDACNLTGPPPERILENKSRGLRAYNNKIIFKTTKYPSEQLKKLPKIFFFNYTPHHAHQFYVQRGRGVYEKMFIVVFFLIVHLRPRDTTPLTLWGWQFFWKRNTTEYNNKSGGYSHNKTIFKNCFNKICPMQVNKLKRKIKTTPFIIIQPNYNEI